MHSSSFLALALGGLSAVAASCAPVVELDYATYEGTSLNGVNQFLGMRYAAPSIGENRFRKPQKPVEQLGSIQQATEHGPICYGVQNLQFPPAPIEASEDCLYIDVYAPANATQEDHDGGLPVLLWLQGGAFVQLFNPNYSGSGLIEAAGGNLIVVSFNYRVGPFGFLASSELQEEGNLNIGLHDQRAAMRWVQDNIHQFGGDPTKVTLFGASVGGGSVVLQTLAYGGQPPEDDNISWRAGIAGSIYLPSVLEVADVQFQYQDLLNATGCADLACLRSLDSATIQDANVLRAFPGQPNPPLFPYVPVVDGSFFTDTPQTMLANGAYAKDKPLILGTSDSEGTIFVPQANTTEDINAFLLAQYPGLTDADLAEANRLYEDVPETYPGVEAAVSPLYYRLAKMYGDVGYTCPTLVFTEGLSQTDVPTHLFRDNIRDPAEVAAGYLVPHTWEVAAVWGPDYAVSYVALPGADSYEEGGVNYGMVALVQSYWTSFALTGGDPNALRVGGAPVWQTFDEEGQRLRLQSNGTAMEPTSQVDHDRCRFWRGLAERTRI